jgi:ankyrin repeat protein
MIFFGWFAYIIITPKNHQIIDWYAAGLFVLFAPVAFYVWAFITWHEPLNIEEWFFAALIFIIANICPVTTYILLHYRNFAEDKTKARRASAIVRFAILAAILVTSLGALGVRTPTAMTVRLFPFLARPLIHAGIGINTRDFQWKSPLGIALDRGDFATASLLVTKGADVKEKYRDNYGKPVRIFYPNKVNGGVKTENLPDDTLLMVVSRRGRLDAMKWLLENGADTNGKNRQGQTALMLAAEGKLEAVKLLLTNGADIQAEDSGGKTALSYAARRGTLETITYLLSQGIRFEQTDKNSALLQAARGYPRGYPPGYNESMSKIQLFLAAGADINARDETGSTPLIYTAGNADLVPMLIGQGADIHAKNNQGTTVLMQSRHNPSTMKLLLEMGAAVDAKDSEGRTALMVTVYGHVDTPNILPLLNAGADINARDNQGRTPLIWAAKYGGGKEKFNLLLDRGAAVNVQDKAGKTPLIYAAWGGPPEIILRMLEMGADPHILDNRGRSALSYALECDKKHNLPELTKTIEYLRRYEAK